jgi:hypothetical protein
VLPSPLLHRRHCCRRRRLLQGRAVDGLKALKKLCVSTQLLSATQAGKRVKALAKHPRPDIAAAAGAAVAAWKEAVVQEAATGAAAKEGSSSGGAAAGAAVAAEGEPSSQQTAAAAVAAPAAAPLPPPPLPLDLGSLPRSGDPLRDKCRQNLAQAFHLAVGEGVEGDAAVCGVAVENEIFRQAGGAVTQVGLWVGWGWWVDGHWGACAALCSACVSSSPANAAVFSCLQAALLPPLPLCPVLTPPAGVQGHVSSVCACPHATCIG